MKRSILLVLALVIVFSTIPVFASSYYEKGNTFFALKAGVNFPAFISFPFSEGKKTYVGPAATKYRIGGTGSLSYQACVSPVIAIGGEIGYTFNYGIDGNITTQVPITGKVTWIPVQTGKFDLGINSNLGFCFGRQNNTKVWGPYASLALNPVVYITDNWGLGLDAGLYVHGTFLKNKENSALFGQLPLTLTVDYRR